LENNTVAHVDTLIDLMDQLVAKYGHPIGLKDQNVIDMGQAICRGLYGVDWMQSPEWRKANDMEYPEVPDEAVQLAREWLEKGMSDWWYE